MYGRMRARAASGSRSRSAHSRARQKRSSPSSIGRDSTGGAATIRAPCAAKRSAAASTAATICGSGASPQPASSIRPIRMPLTCAGAIDQSIVSGGRLVASRQSGRDRKRISSAASSIVRVIGPAQRPV